METETTWKRHANCPLRAKIWAPSPTHWTPTIHRHLFMLITFCQCEKKSNNWEYFCFTGYYKGLMHRRFRQPGKPAMSRRNVSSEPRGTHRGPSSELVPVNCFIKLIIWILSHMSHKWLFKMHDKMSWNTPQCWENLHHHKQYFTTKG